MDVSSSDSKLVDKKILYRLEFTDPDLTAI